MSQITRPLRYILADGSAWRRKGRLDLLTQSRDNLVYGTYKPTSTTTGLLPGWVDSETIPGVGEQQLTALNGTQTITTNNTVLQNRDIFGFVNVRAANVQIINCKIRGNNSATTEVGIVNAHHQNCVNLLVKDCLLVPDYPSYWITGLFGHDYTAERCDIHSVVDGFGAFNSNSGHTTDPIYVRIYGSYVHDLSYYSPDPNHGDNRTHNDGIQIQGSSDIIIRGNRFEANASSTVGDGYNNSVPAPLPVQYRPSVTGQAIGITPNVSAVANTIIDQNWIDYGAQSITIAVNTYNVGSGISITNNRFGRNQPNLTKDSVAARRAIAVQNGVNSITGVPATTGTDTTLGNVYDDDDSPVTIWRLGAP
ncbi:MAG: hypothetical protein WBP26_02150 [Candidatus Saccharimonadales bacterium]